MDVDDVTQIAVYIRGCYSKFSTEELLELIPMHVVTTGEDIFCKVESLFQKFNCHWMCLVTDGAPVLWGC
jgi:hypothetical protein